MKTRLVLSLTDAWLTLEVCRPERLARVEVEGPINQGTLTLKLGEALSALSKAYQGSLRAGNLEVQLGLSFSRIGLMDLADAAGKIPNDRAYESYAQAWVRQMMHLDPVTQVLRWELQSDGQKLLISCIDRVVFDSLSAFALQHGMRFTSCRPAVLNALKAPSSDIVVCTEPGLGKQRSSLVQLLSFTGERLTAAWRGWLPPSDEVDGTDLALEGAIRRFRQIA